jgi:hypothetical protein
LPQPPARPAAWLIVVIVIVSTLLVMNHHSWYTGKKALVQASRIYTWSIHGETREGNGLRMSVFCSAQLSSALYLRWVSKRLPLPTSSSPSAAPCPSDRPRRARSVPPGPLRGGGAVKRYTRGVWSGSGIVIYIRAARRVVLYPQTGGVARRWLARARDRRSPCSCPSVSRTCAPAVCL